jgi:hypothetical protein
MPKPVPPAVLVHAPRWRGGGESAAAAQAELQIVIANHAADLAAAELDEVTAERDELKDEVDELKQANVVLKERVDELKLMRQLVQLRRRTIVMPAKCDWCYIEMGDRTYYIDDSTGEGFVDHWQTEIEVDSR